MTFMKEEKGIGVITILTKELIKLVVVVVVVVVVVIILSLSVY